MPRIRTLKPEHRQHRKVGRLTDREYRLWVALILEADDEGRLIEDRGALKLAAFGYFPAVTEAHITAALEAIERSGLIRRYSTDCLDIIAFPSWHDHQRIDRPRPSLLPSYDDSTIVRRSFDERSTMIRGGSEGIGSDRKGSEGSERSRAIVEDSSSLGADAPSAPARIKFQISPDITAALDRCRVLGQAARLRDARWWQAQVRAHHAVDYPGELLKAEAWIATHPDRAPRKDHARFMHSWFSRAGERNGTHA